MDIRIGSWSPVVPSNSGYSIIWECKPLLDSQMGEFYSYLLSLIKECMLGIWSWSWSWSFLEGEDLHNSCMGQWVPQRQQSQPGWLVVIVNVKGLLAVMSNQSLSGVTPLNTLELLKSKIMSAEGKSCFWQNNDSFTIFSEAGTFSLVCFSSSNLYSWSRAELQVPHKWKAIT